MIAYFDSHCHLQDERLGPRVEEILSACREAGICAMVVNGTSEADWPRVRRLAEQHPDLVRPSYGLHPWHANDRSEDWFERLREYVSDDRCIGIGEVGLDKWVKGHDFEAQKQVFEKQIRLAAERDLPLSIHCLQAWGSLLECMQQGERPQRGFLLHSFGGPREMVASFVELGAYFSFSGYHLREEKAAKREAFRDVPPDRLLMETDAPDMNLPEALECCHLAPEGENGNHPANLPVIYEEAAKWWGEPLSAFASRVGANFQRLFPKSPGTPVLKRSRGWRGWDDS